MIYLLYFWMNLKMVIRGSIFLKLSVILLMVAATQTVHLHKPNEKVVFEKGVKHKPVVLIPGVLGSRLQAKLDLKESPGYFCDKKRDWFDIWLNIEELIPLYVDCWVYDIGLHYDNATANAYNKKGVTTRVLDFGDTSDFEYLDQDHLAPGSPYFNKLVDFMVELGYERGKDLKGAPYDWRHTPSLSDDYFENLTKLIENNYYEHFNQKVVLVGHSMGNMFTYYMLKKKPQEWKDKFIDSFISINSPYIGSVKALKAITSGETEGHDFVLPKLKLREATRTFLSSFLLLPRPSLWPKDKIQVVDTFVKNYTVFDYEALFKRINCEDCWSIWKAFGREMGDLSAPDVPVHCIYSAQKPTPEVLVYDPDLFPDGTPVLKTGDGDGTVNTFSSSYCLKWAKGQKQPVYDGFMPGNDHVGILSNATLFAYIKNVVTIPNFGNEVLKFNIL